MIPGFSWPYQLLIAAVLLAGAFGGGWYMGDTHAIKAAARATASIAAKAAKDQHDIDIKDRQIADADQSQRAAKNNAGEVKYKILYRDRTKLVPDPTHKCKVPANAMKLLNDPDLAGELAP